MDSVTLRIRVAGESTIVLYRSTAKGFSHPVETITVQSDEPETVERTLPLAPFIDGGWYWFDIVAGPRATTLIEAEWLALTEPAPAGRVSIGITTFNRPEYMLDGLRTLGEATEVHELLDRVYVIDQGTDRVRNQPGFADAAKKLGDLLQVIEQGNIGGSGGFARSMDETVQAGQSDYVLLMDDDVKLDPEGILRAATFADLAPPPDHRRRPHVQPVRPVPAARVRRGHRPVQVVVGDRAEHQGPARFRPAEPAEHALAAPPGRLRLQRLVDVPDPDRRSSGRSAWRCRCSSSGTTPNTGYGPARTAIPRCRCRAWPAGRCPGMTRMTPGTGRLTITCATGWSPPCCTPRSRTAAKLLSESMERQLQSLLSMQYSTAALRLLAIEDVLTGPDHLHRELGTKLKQLREYRLEFPDAQGAADIESFPPARRRAPEAVKDSTTPTNRVNLLTKAASGTARQFRPVRGGARKRPQMALPFQDASWWVLVKLDSALVSTAEGTTAAWYQRDPKLFRSLGLRSVIAHRKLRRQWARLAAEYRAAAAGFNSPEKWRETFAASADDRPSGP